MKKIRLRAITLQDKLNIARYPIFKKCTPKLFRILEALIIFLSGVSI